MLTSSIHNITQVSTKTINGDEGPFVCVDVECTPQERVHLFVTGDTAELVAAGLRAAAEHIEAYAKDNDQAQFRA